MKEGLTKQRIGVERVVNQTEVVCFLDDDTVLKWIILSKFKDFIKYIQMQLGVGGYNNNESKMGI
jgi:hypothetical protein